MYTLYFIRVDLFLFYLDDRKPSVFYNILTRTIYIITIIMIIMNNNDDDDDDDDDTL